MASDNKVSLHGGSVIEPMRKLLQRTAPSHLLPMRLPRIASGPLLLNYLHRSLLGQWLGSRSGLVFAQPWQTSGHSRLNRAAAQPLTSGEGFAAPIEFAQEPFKPVSSSADVARSKVETVIRQSSPVNTSSHPTGQIRRSVRDDSSRRPVDRPPQGNTAPLSVAPQIHAETVPPAAHTAIAPDSPDNETVARAPEDSSVTRSSITVYGSQESPSDERSHSRTPTEETADPLRQPTASEQQLSVSADKTEAVVEDSMPQVHAVPLVRRVADTTATSPALFSQRQETPDAANEKSVSPSASAERVSEGRSLPAEGAGLPIGTSLPVESVSMPREIVSRAPVSHVSAYETRPELRLDPVTQIPSDMSGQISDQQPGRQSSGDVAPAEISGSDALTPPSANIVHRYPSSLLPDAAPIVSSEPEQAGVSAAISPVQTVVASDRASNTVTEGVVPNSPSTTSNTIAHMSLQATSSADDSTAQPQLAHRANETGHPEHLQAKAVESPLQASQTSADLVHLTGSGVVNSSLPESTSAASVREPNGPPPPAGKSQAAIHDRSDINASADASSSSASPDVSLKSQNVVDTVTAPFPSLDKHPAGSALNTGTPTRAVDKSSILSEAIVANPIHAIGVPLARQPGKGTIATKPDGADTKDGSAERSVVGAGSVTEPAFRVENPLSGAVRGTPNLASRDVFTSPFRHIEPMASVGRDVSSSFVKRDVSSSSVRDASYSPVSNVSISPVGHDTSSFSVKGVPLSPTSGLSISPARHDTARESPSVAVGHDGSRHGETDPSSAVIGVEKGPELESSSLPKALVHIGAIGAAESQSGRRGATDSRGAAESISPEHSSVPVTALPVHVPVSRVISSPVTDSPAVQVDEVPATYPRNPMVPLSAGGNASSSTVLRKAEGTPADLRADGTFNGASGKHGPVGEPVNIPYGDVVTGYSAGASGVQRSQGHVTEYAPSASLPHMVRNVVSRQARTPEETESSKIQSAGIHVHSQGQSKATVQASSGESRLSVHSSMGRHSLVDVGPATRHASEASNRLSVPSPADSRYEGSVVMPVVRLIAQRSVSGEHAKSAVVQNSQLNSSVSSGSVGAQEQMVAAEAAVLAAHRESESSTPTVVHRLPEHGPDRDYSPQAAATSYSPAGTDGFGSDTSVPARVFLKAPPGNEHRGSSDPFAAAAYFASLTGSSSPGTPNYMKVHRSVDVGAPATSLASTGFRAISPMPQVGPGAPQDQAGGGLDIQGLADQVYRLITQRISNESERRGL